MMGWMKSSSREVMMSWGLQRKKSRMEKGKSKINCARTTIITFADDGSGDEYGDDSSSGYGMIYIT